jgi:hypothetical protein
MYAIETTGFRCSGRCFRTSSNCSCSKEALAGVIDVKHLNLPPNADLAGADAEAKPAPQHRKFIVHRRAGGTRFEPMCLIGGDAVNGYFPRFTIAAEKAA